ncbi:MAG TPA: HtaA domain-containing protein [Solirubrobacterales bacterium]|nr:HtaA domain-containing protein [Solirubrobacterales bacterium]
MARGTKLPAAVLAAALFALLAFAPFASAATDPVKSGSATVTLNSGFVKSLKKQGVKIGKIGKAKLKGKRATFPVTGGEMDPTTGAGALNLAGGLKFTAGKRKAPVRALVVNTVKKGLFAKVGAKKVKLAKLAGISFVRNGFGVNLTVKKLKLTNAAARQLNKKLGFKSGPKPFKGNRLMARAFAEEQPSTVTILPGGNVAFAANTATLGKLAKVKVDVKPVAPTQVKGLGNFEFPINGGTIAPDASAGVVQTNGGIVLTQKLPTGASTALETEITLGNFFVDLSAKTVSVEVTLKSNASEELNRGAIGRASVADLSLTAAVIGANTTTRTVTVQNAGASLQPIAAEVLNGFVKVYEGYLQAQGKTAEEAKQEQIAAGDPLGVFSLTAQTQ